MDTRTEIVENMCGGAGHVTIKHLLGDEQMHGSCSLYAQVTIEPGSELGYHEHHGESETYYIISGDGIYNDNGTLRRVRPGDVTFTPDGMGHALKPADSEKIVFMALIIKD